MKRHSPEPGTTALKLICLACLSNFYDDATGATMPVLKPSMSEILAKTRTVCLGRFLIDVPIAANVVYGPARIKYAIERVEKEGANIAVHVRNGLEKIESQRFVADKNRFGPESMYGKVIDGKMPGQKLTFGTSDNLYYRIESYFEVGADLYVQKAFGYFDHFEYRNEVHELNRLAPLFQPRKDDEIPTAPGICIDGAFVNEPNPPVIEAVTMGIRLTDYPDVHFSIKMTKKDILVNSDALEPRYEKARERAIRTGAGAWHASIRMLRKGKHDIDQWKGFQVLAFKPAQATEGESHEFAFLSQGEPNNPMLPVLDIQLNTGVSNNRVGGVRPSITDDEALAVWDQLTKSIRPRPVKLAMDQPRPPTALGSKIAAYTACPQSGWWEYGDDPGHMVAGGRQQYFRTGECVPQASLLYQETFWQKLRGEYRSFSHTDPSNWTLVDRRSLPRVNAPPLLQPATAALVASQSLTAEVSTVPLSTVMTSGDHCPASGWWRCMESKALDHTRWFRQGDLLPLATVSRPASWQQKMGHNNTSQHVRATWQLMRLDQSVADMPAENFSSDQEG